ncbi:MAG: type II toxin-antitoxin system prevent-host-death family antitoxin [Firmicutes bacterium]|nr:type II toxin-antitoxin system prevent-host-death family antitoxin [Bacillota bacterium]
MREVGAYEAKTHLAELLDAAEKGETIIVTRRGKPIAKITPYRPSAMTIDAIAQEFARLRSSVKPGESLRDLIEEGRRF